VDSTLPIHRSRRYDIDWLRVLGVYGLFPIHVAMVFNPAPFYHIRNTTLSFGMFILARFIDPWYMPLFFVLAGWSVCSSLQARGGRRLLRRYRITPSLSFLQRLT